MSPPSEIHSDRRIKPVLIEKHLNNLFLLSDYSTPPPPLAPAALSSQKHLLLSYLFYSLRFVSTSRDVTARGVFCSVLRDVRLARASEHVFTKWRVFYGN